MKSIIAAAVLSTFTMAAFADDLAAGMKAWEKRDFAQAQQTYTRLANAGNVQAQLLLGELYGFGEGVPEDLAQAEKWLAKAQAGGNPDAAATLANLRQRAARKSDIARYVDAGAAQSLVTFDCVRPVFPEKSRSRHEMRAVDAATKAWRACYGRYADSLAAGPVKAIPQDIVNLMNLAELDRARSAMSQAQAQVAEAEAKVVMAGYDAWYGRTKNFMMAVQYRLTNESNQRQFEATRSRDQLPVSRRNSMRASTESTPTPTPSRLAAL